MTCKTAIKKGIFSSSARYDLYSLQHLCWHCWHNLMNCSCLVTDWYFGSQNMIYRDCGMRTFLSWLLKLIMYAVFIGILSSSISKHLMQCFSTVDLIFLLKKYVTSVQSANTATLHLSISPDISFISSDASKHIVFVICCGTDLIQLF